MYYMEELFTHREGSVYGITIENKRGIQVKLLNVGATLVQLLMTDKDGHMENIVLSYKNLKDYLVNPSYFGATIGRTSGRISQGAFTLDGEKYVLEKNFGDHHGHGGYNGFTFKIWNVDIKKSQDRNIVEFSYKSRDGEGNYPGNLEVKCSYILTDSNQLIIEYRARSDRKTLCNLTNHTYFNLSGNAKRKITNQYLKVNADHFLELDHSMIPTGKWIPVDNTPMDFREFKLIGADMDGSYGQLRMAKGYDHPWMLRGKEEQIQMWDKISGRSLTISTTYPCVVIYTLNQPKGETMENGRAASNYDGICFETQYEPDGINHSELCSGTIEPQKEYLHRIHYSFNIEPS